MYNVVGPTLVGMATTFALGAESNRLPACQLSFLAQPIRQNDDLPRTNNRIRSKARDTRTRNRRQKKTRSIYDLGFCGVCHG